MTFANVVLGALLVSRAPTPALLASLALAYLSFNVLLYGGVYTINAVADRESDARHPGKRLRPLPSRRVGAGAAVAFAAAILAAGLASGYLLFDRRVFCVYVAALALNALYTFFARGVAYLEIVVNSATHPLRLLMGAYLAGGDPPPALVLAAFFLAFGIAAVRRCVERDVSGWEARRALRHYSDRALLLLRVCAVLAILLLLGVDRSLPAAVDAGVAAACAVLVFGIEAGGAVRRFYVSMWTR